MEFFELTVDAGVATLRLNRPPVNALNFAMQAEMIEASELITANPEIAAVVIYGGEKAFAAGADIKEMERLTHDQMVERSYNLHSAFTAIAHIPKPVVAAITGYALGGGCEFAMCADLRFAAENSKLGQPEILLGIIPGAGGTQRLTRLVGPSVAKDLVFSGRMVSASEALEIGLVNRLFPAESVYSEAVAWARQFVGGPAAAIAAAKRVIDAGQEGTLEQGLEIERQAFADLFATEDRAIGMESFIAHGSGKAQFKGR
ncbi:MAG: enoyl-CoA hydratase [Actinobacteria bacterium]|nr:MAG: enoyl-CoA hydratase [Actinomycetota bacterium]